MEIVSWGQVHEEAKGNIEYRPGVSAYALCYIKASSSNLLSDAAQTIQERLQSMPEDLREFVFRRNSEFEEEIRRYKESREPPPPEPIIYPNAEYVSDFS